MLSHTSKPQHKITASLVTTLVIVIALVAFIIWPSFTRIKELRGNIMDQRVELERIYLQGQSLKKTVEQYQEIKSTISLLNSVYIKEGKELALIESLEQLAEQQSIDQDIKLATIDPNKNQGKLLPLQLTITGNFNDLITYLAGLESLSYYLNITTLRISAGSSLGTQFNNTNNTSITALLVANSYYEP
ncbi:MAG: type 4a pilus biogenesis protein PilO [Patescibacteria group bacterium]